MTTSHSTERNPDDDLSGSNSKNPLQDLDHPASTAPKQPQLIIPQVILQTDPVFSTTATLAAAPQQTNEACEINLISLTESPVGASLAQGVIPTPPPTFFQALWDFFRLLWTRIKSCFMRDTHMPLHTGSHTSYLPDGFDKDCDYTKYNAGFQEKYYHLWNEKGQMLSAYEEDLEKEYTKLCSLSETDRLDIKILTTHLDALTSYHHKYACALQKIEKQFLGWQARLRPHVYQSIDERFTHPDSGLVHIQATAEKAASLIIERFRVFYIDAYQHRLQNIYTVFNKKLDTLVESFLDKNPISVNFSAFIASVKRFQEEAQKELMNLHETFHSLSHLPNLANGLTWEEWYRPQEAALVESYNQVHDRIAQRKQDITAWMQLWKTRMILPELIALRDYQSENLAQANSLLPKCRAVTAQLALLAQSPPWELPPLWVSPFILVQWKMELSQHHAARFRTEELTTEALQDFIASTQDWVERLQGRLQTTQARAQAEEERLSTDWQNTLDTQFTQLDEALLQQINVHVGRLLSRKEGSHQACDKLCASTQRMLTQKFDELQTWVSPQYGNAFLVTAYAQAKQAIVEKSALAKKFIADITPLLSSINKARGTVPKSFNKGIIRLLRNTYHPDKQQQYGTNKPHLRHLASALAVKLTDMRENPPSFGSKNNFVAPPMTAEETAIITKETAIIKGVSEQLAARIQIATEALQAAAAQLETAKVGDNLEEVKSTFDQALRKIIAEFKGDSATILLPLEQLAQTNQLAELKRMSCRDDVNDLLARIGMKELRCHTTLLMLDTKLHCVEIDAHCESVTAHCESVTAHCESVTAHCAEADAAYVSIKENSAQTSALLDRMLGINTEGETNKVRLEKQKIALAEEKARLADEKTRIAERNAEEKARLADEKTRIAERNAEEKARLADEKTRIAERNAEEKARLADEKTRIAERNAEEKARLAEQNLVLERREKEMAERDLELGRREKVEADQKAVTLPVVMETQSPEGALPTASPGSPPEDESLSSTARETDSPAAEEAPIPSSIVPTPSIVVGARINFFNTQLGGALGARMRRTETALTH